MDNIDLFIEYLKKDVDLDIKALEKRERDSGFPIIKPGVQNLLLILMELLKPKRILELGTGVGFSSILMAKAIPYPMEITTIELKEKNYNRALKNIEDFGLLEKINCILGDAGEVLEDKTKVFGEYDFIFIDFAKAQYLNVWGKVRGLVKPGGIILTDDVLQNKTVAGSRFLLGRRDRTIHDRMREFLYLQMNDQDFTGNIFEIDDGISLLVRNKDE